MIIRRIDGCTRVLGKAQGFMGLPVRDEQVQYEQDGATVLAPCMATAWEPTPDEIERLRQGKSLIVRIVGRAHPPIKVEVAE